MIARGYMYHVCVEGIRRDRHLLGDLVNTDVPTRTAREMVNYLLLPYELLSFIRNDTKKSTFSIAAEAPNPSPFQNLSGWSQLIHHFEL
ncbi:hypothetical protein T265_10739 [Opisthorchis viverrini]|uniref:Uncharacterized protein n=1 Tax=Opisthorchis viverrini TaxID=6198 RepID=A0A074Z176_OPIVI|nr:hypothetical protein T265_10739 [Opisthorchis viverrini]KER20801.1 hypothetical protein T265_10739 [Opisthorchis viverrini]